MSEEEKTLAVKEFVEMTTKATLEFFHMMGLESHIETMIINDRTKEEYVFSFKKV